MATANFYTSAAGMMGVDEHPYVPAATKAEEPTPHAALASIGDGDDLLPEIFADGHHMVHKGSKVTGMHCPHIPLTPKPPDGKEAMTFLKVQKDASTSADHATPTVFAHGTPLAICFVWLLGVDTNCGTKPYNNIVLSPCTVVTHATIDDQVRKAIKSWVDQLWAWLKDFLKKKLPDLVWKALVARWPFLKPFEKILKPILNKVVGWAVDALDWALSPADRIYKGIMKLLGDDGEIKQMK